MQLITVIFLAFAFTCSLGDKLDEANNYMDEVLTDYLPTVLEEEGLIVYEMPGFHHTHQNRSSDGSVLNTRIFYWGGNLTGLQNAFRQNCEEPSWSSGNISVVCHNVLPHLQVEYAGRFQTVKGFDNPFGVHVRQFDFTLYIDIREVEFILDVTSSPRIQIPSIDRLSMESLRIFVKFHTEAPSSEDVTVGVQHQVLGFFDELFYGPFKNALETSVRSVRYPKSQ